MNISSNVCMLNLNKLVTVVNEAQSRVKSVAKVIINSQFGNKSSKSSNWDSEADALFYFHILSPQNICCKSSWRGWFQFA